jgi:hypothetical protein
MEHARISRRVETYVFKIATAIFPESQEGLKLNAIPLVCTLPKPESQEGLYAT